MIARLRGRIAGRAGTGLIVDVNGVGYLVHAAPSELRLGATRVGPKVALAILSGSTPAELRRAIARDDVKRFQAIPGIGLKTAQRVVLELKEKLADTAGAVDELQARDALVDLGWSVLDAERALADVDPALGVEEQVRAALRRAA